MKKIFIIVCLIIPSCFKSFSQPVSFPKFYSFNDTTRNYYLTFCEEFNSIFDNYYDQYNMKPDSCIIDFSKFDLKGTRENGELKWEQVSPKKYLEVTYSELRDFDTIRWKVFPRNMIIEDTNTFNELKKNAKRNLKDSFDFSKIALIYNDVWIDCMGSFYYKVLYDPCENTLICNQVEIYGGCHGMRPTDSWITIKKPNPDTKIKVKRFWVN